MNALRITGERPGPQVTVRCKGPGGPWFVGLGGLGEPEVELGPYENPAVAREDAAKLRQFLALMTPALAKPTPGEPSSAATNDTGHGRAWSAERENG